MLIKLIKIIPILIICLFLISCKAKVKELSLIDQNHILFNAEKIKDKPIVSKKYQSLINKQFNQKFLSPWKIQKKQIKKNKVLWGFNYFKNKKGFAENKQPYEKNWLEKIKNNADLKNYPNNPEKAITIQNTNIRILPTNKPFFENFHNEGEGFPFDKMQTTTIPAGTPIYITHISKDQKWIFLQTSLAAGWADIRNIAYVKKKFEQSFNENLGYIAITNEKTPILTKNKNFLFEANLGSLFPLSKIAKYNYLIKVPMANSNRIAFIKEVYVLKRKSTPKPLKMTLANMIKLSDQLINQPYGWGGLYNNRDCSALIRDLYTPFGIWLPRNSESQSKSIGTRIKLDLLTNDQKEKFIIENAIPYVTLLWFPGHIMLYIGHKDNKAYVFHNIWGLKTKNKFKRKLIGKAIISDLEIGIKQSDISKEASLLNRVQSMTILVPNL